MNRELPYSSVTLPTVPFDCRPNCEPSLNDLQDFVTNIDIQYEYDRTVIDEYMKSTKSIYTDGKYYLFGQVLTYPDTKLTTNILDDAINYNRKKAIEYGGPANGMEYSSILRSERLFKDLIHIIGLYYISRLEIEYQPGNTGYLRCLQHFTDTK